MAFKFVVVFACIAAASAGLLAPAAPLAAIAKVEEYDPFPQYTYGYDVKDALTGDSKNAVETREGDVVRGQYSLNDADGYRRIVDYTSDPINGFNAVVSRVPLVAAAPALIKAAPVVAAPALLKAAPVVAAPALLKAAPVVAAPALLKAAPVATPLVTGGQAIVKSSFASPVISYAW